MKTPTPSKPKTKLTPKMREVLEGLAKPKVSAYFMPYMGRFNPDAYWYTSDDTERCTSQVNALINRGLVSITHRDDLRGHRAAITPAGREALKQSEVEHGG